MKVRKTVSAILISVVLVLCILLFAVAANSAKLTENLITSFLTSYNSENPSFIISYDSLNPTATSGIKLDGLCVGNGSDVFLSVSEVDVSSGVVDVLRMLFGISPKSIEVSVNGARFYANDAFLESVANMSGDSKGKKKSDSSFSLPFTVEVTVENLWADVDIPECKCSIGNINAFARLDKSGLALANVNIPFISAVTGLGSVTAKDLRISADSTYTIRFSSEKLSLDDKFEVEKASAIADFEDSKFNVSVQLPAIYCFGAVVYNTAVVASIDSDEVLADLSLKKVSYKFDKGPVQDVWIGDLTASASWSDENGLKARGTSGLYCLSDSELIKNVSSVLEFYADIPDFDEIVSSSVFCLKVNNIVCPVLDGNNSFEAYLYNLDEIKVSGSLLDGLDLGASFNLSGFDGIATVSFNNLVPNAVSKAVDSFAPKIKTLFVDDTSLNGQLFAKFALKDSWFDAEFDAGLDINDVFFMSALRDAHANIKAVSSEGLLKFEQFDVATGDYSAFYDGTIDMSWGGMDGHFAVVNQKENKSLADFIFTPSGEHVYHMHAVSESLPDYSMETDVSYVEKRKFDVSSILVTEFASYPIDVSIEAFSDFALTIKDSNNQIDVLLGRDKAVRFDSRFGGLEVWLKEDKSVGIEGSFNGIVYTKDLEFNVSFNETTISYSDFITGTFDMTVTNSSIDVTSMSLYLADSYIPIEGNMVLGFRDIKNLALIDLQGIMDLKKDSLATIDSSALTIKANLKTAKGDKFKVSYSDRLLMASADSNYLDIPVKINAMGSLKDVLYADVKFGDVSFELSYSDKKANIYKADGKIGAFDIAGLSAEVDTVKHTMDGSVNLNLTLKNHTGDVTSRADIVFNAELVRLGDILEGKLFSGSEYKIEIQVSNAQISDSLPLADTDINITYKNGVISLNGKLINGKYRLSDGYTKLSVNRALLFGFEAEGYFGTNVDIKLSDIFFPIEVINPLINVPVVTFLEGDVTGSLLLKGPLNDIMFYGMLYCSTFDMEVFYLPNQKITANNLVITANEHTISLPSSPFVGYSETDNRIFEGSVKVEAIFLNTKFESFEVYVKVGNKPFDFWIPLKIGSINLNLEGDVYDGEVKIGLDSSAKLSIIGEAYAENFFGSFVFPDNMPDWFFEGGAAPIMDLKVKTGKNVEVYYPDIENSLINLTCQENEMVRLLIDEYGNFSSEGDFSVKTGRVYYFNNDFYVTDGHMYFEDNQLLGNGFQIYIDVEAKTRQYDSNGSPLDIYLTMNNATFDNMSMRFSSSSALTENELIQILGQAVLPTSDGVSLASVASLAYTATEAVQKLNLVDSNDEYSIAETLKDALGLDFLSARSPLLANILLDSLPGEDSGISLLSKYLNGTSVFAGKYYGNNIFARVIVLLESDTSANKLSHFLTDDLALDVEFSLEWDNPLAMFTVFTKPQELSAFGFLDTIGLTVSKTLRY